MQNRELPGLDRGHVLGSLNYIASPSRKPRYYTFEPCDGESRENFRHAPRICRIRNARRLQGELSFERDGFGLLAHRSSVGDFSDDEQVRSVYYPEACALLSEATGAARVVVFDHATRKRPPGRPPLGFGRPPNYTTLEPVGRVHNDYTQVSGERRAREALDQMGIPRTGTRIVQFNLWRAISEPLLDAPLAVCSAASVSFDDLVACDIVYPGRTGELYLATHNSAHRWYYYPLMRADEVLVFSGYDSARDGAPRFTLHSAFEDPTAPPDAPPRHSIELRAFALFG